MSVATKLAKAAMKLREVVPDPANTDGLQEVFNLRGFLHASQSQRNEIMLKSCHAKYREEVEYPWDAYFEIDIVPLLTGKSVLDMGCFNGGRGAAWYERYTLSQITGIDVDHVFIEAATRFAAARGIRAQYTLAQGEELPFEDRTFDAILSFDVLEHVRSVSATMKECYRVLKPGGRFFLVFPSYFHPNEHHLGMVTRLPGIQYLFSGKTLIRAYSEILAERGDGAYWYQRGSNEPAHWERGHTINGTTLARFRPVLRELNWRILHQSRKPILTVGRNMSRSALNRFAGTLLTPLARVPGVQEVFLHRLTFVLEKLEEPIPPSR
jgi:2-polyprenyl-3-methyl-5-hydroxy-6-metoxy-1,4-benzoquinol methylase